MGASKEKINDAIDGMSDAQRKSALYYLVGYNTPVAAIVVQWALVTYPEPGASVSGNNL